MMKQQDKPIKLRMDAATYYVWVGGSCDYAHKERAGGGAYIMEKDCKVVERYDIADLHTTEFRMMLTVMLHAMETLPEGSSRLSDKCLVHSELRQGTDRCFR